MIHAGNAITVQMLSDGIAEFRFDLQGESVNKFNRATIEDFKAAIDAVKAENFFVAVLQPDQNRAPSPALLQFGCEVVVCR
jgi:hypothetical protein